MNALCLWRGAITLDWCMPGPHPIPGLPITGPRSCLVPQRELRSDDDHMDRERPASSLNSQQGEANCMVVGQGHGVGGGVSVLTKAVAQG